MTRRGVIDLGSNTVRLVVFQVDDQAQRRAVREHVPLAKSDFKALVNEKKVAGLSAYVENGEFTSEGVAKAVSILSRHLQTARNLDCEQVDIIATAVLRNCSNSAQAVEQIQEQIGHPVRLLSSDEESHFSCAGARLSRPFDDGLLVDMGGGSTELVRVEDGAIVRSVSVDQGCVSSYARHVRELLPTSAECAAIKASMVEKLDRTAQEGLLPEGGFSELYAVGGGVRAAARMAAALSGVQAKSTPSQVTAEGIADVLAFLEGDPGAFAHLAVKVVPERLHSLVPGCLVLQAVMERYGAQRFLLCKGGLREGFLSVG